MRRSFSRENHAPSLLPFRERLRISFPLPFGKKALFVPLLLGERARVRDLLFPLSP
ncbi:hypothetical protein H5T57_02670 [Candidatus Bipolaricaulota bacterium]|nr:hypothetical protein [Candidatus Bipolaricaulota bacterium]